MRRQAGASRSPGWLVAALTGGTVVLATLLLRQTLYEHTFLLVLLAAATVAGLILAHRYAPTPLDLPLFLLLAFLPITLLQLRTTPLVGVMRRPPQDVPAASAFPPVRRGMKLGPNDYAYLDANQGTLSLWFRPLGWSGGDGRKHVLVERTYQDAIFIGENGKLTLSFPGTYGAVAGAIDAARVQDGSWYNVAFSWNARAPVSDGNYAVAYLDGAPVGTRSTPFDPSLGLIPDDYLAGSVGGVAVDSQIEGFAGWSRPLDDHEIQRLAAGDHNSAGLVADPALRFFQPATPGAADTVGAAPGNDNLLRDGRMEEPGTSAWSTAGNHVSADKTAAIVFGDFQSLHVLATGPGAAGQSLRLRRERSYAVDVWLRVDSGAVVVAIEDDHGRRDAISPELGTGPAWQHVSLAFVASGPSRLLFEASGSGADFYADDASVLPATLVSAPITLAGGLSQSFAVDPAAWYALRFYATGPLAAPVTVEVAGASGPTPALASGSIERPGETFSFQPGATGVRVTIAPPPQGGAGSPAPAAQIALVRLHTIDTTGVSDMWRAFGKTIGLPKIAGLLLGVLIFSVAVLMRPWLSLRALGWLALAAGLVLALAAPLAVERVGNSKVLPVDAVLARLPLIKTGLVRGTSNGGINPNEAGGALALFLPLGFAVAITARGKERWLAAACIAVMAISLVVTASRGALVGAGVGVYVVAVWRRPRLLRWLPVVIVILVLAVAGLALGGTGRGEHSLAWRLSLWRDVLPIARDHPLTGTGIGQFGLVYASYYPPGCVTLVQCVPHAHNLVLDAWLQLGLPAALMYLAVIAVALTLTIRVACRHADRLGGLAAGSAAGILAFLVFGTVDTIAPGARGGLLLWFALAIAAAIAATAHGRATPLEADGGPAAP